MPHADEAPSAREEASASPETRPIGPEARDEAATAAILKGIEGCYQRQVSSFGVHFSIHSSLSLAILPNGLVREGIFDPPLSPTLMTCAHEAVAAAHFPRHDGVREIRVPVIFARPGD